VQLGVTEGVKNFAAETGTQFDIISQGVTRLGGTISSQLTQAVKDGAFSFRDFALSVVQSIQEIITKLLVQIALQTALNALSKGGGGGTIVGAATSVIGGAAQEGATIGPAATGQAFLVGEGGEPELFKPKVTGDIIPAAATADMLGGGAPPEVNVQVVNVDDNSSVPDAMSTREGEQVVLNIIQRNKNTLREIIA
jgi:lambda family phage tail tape measure protein